MDANKNYSSSNFDLLSLHLGKYLNDFAIDNNQKTQNF